MAICKNANLEGIRIGGLEHHIALYADDVILFCSKLEHTRPTLLDLLRFYFAGYKVNDSKCLFIFIMFLNEMRQKTLRFPFPFWSKGFTYLGIEISPTIDKIVPNNYNPMLDKVTQLVNRWT